MDVIDTFWELSLDVKRNFDRLLQYAKSGQSNAIVIQENSGRRADCTTSAVLIDGIVFTDGGLYALSSKLYWLYGVKKYKPITIDDILMVQEVMSNTFSKLNK